MFNVNPSSMLSDVSWTSTATLSSYTHDSVQEGLDLSGLATIAMDGSLAAKLEIFDSNPKHQFGGNLFNPVFSQQPEELTFSLYGMAIIRLAPNIYLKGFQV